MRLHILRHLLTKPATISQLGTLLNRHPAQIKYHLSLLEKNGLVELAYTRTVKNYKEKYYKARSNAVFLNMSILPWPSEKGQIVILGGDGPGLDLLVDHVNRSVGDTIFYLIPSGSLDSLIYLRENYCQVAGCHLFDMESGDFNISYIRHLFAFKDMVVVTFGHREQGLLLPRGNPNKVTSIKDVVQKRLTFVNRPLGSGTRLRLDLLLSEEKILPGDLIGYEDEVETHNEVGERILSGKADVGLGIAATAKSMNMDFKYLFTERYDLVMSKKKYQSPYMQLFINELQSPVILQRIEELGGYNLEQAGIVTEI